MNHFFIVYDDLTVYDSDCGKPPKAWGVEVIVQSHEKVGWHTQTKYDFYIVRDNRWVGVDRAGLMDHVQEELGVARFNIGTTHQVLLENEWIEVDEFGFYKWLSSIGICLFGRTLTTRDFEEAMRVALSIRKVQIEKVGWLRDEERPS